jgi:hypothetical protein
MSRFDTYRDSFPNAQLTRSKLGVLEVALHTGGGTLIFDGHTHEQFVDLFHAIGSGRRGQAANSNQCARVPGCVPQLGSQTALKGQSHHKLLI